MKPFLTKASSENGKRLVFDSLGPVFHDFALSVQDLVSATKSVPESTASSKNHNNVVTCVCTLMAVVRHPYPASVTLWALSPQLFCTTWTVRTRPLLKLSPAHESPSATAALGALCCCECPVSWLFIIGSFVPACRHGNAGFTEWIGRVPQLLRLKSFGVVSKKCMLSSAAIAHLKSWEFGTKFTEVIFDQKFSLSHDTVFLL